MFRDVKILSTISSKNDLNLIDKIQSMAVCQMKLIAKKRNENILRQFRQSQILEIWIFRINKETLQRLSINKIQIQLADTSTTPPLDYLFVNLKISIFINKSIINLSILKMKVLKTFLKKKKKSNLKLVTILPAFSQESVKLLNGQFDNTEPQEAFLWWVGGLSKSISHHSWPMTKN